MKWIFLQRIPFLRKTKNISNKHKLYLISIYLNYQQKGDFLIDCHSNAKNNFGLKKVTA